MCYFVYLRFKVVHRSNYIFGSLSGALPFLGGWLAAAPSVPLDLAWLSVPLFVTFYMWHWQKIHFAFITKRYKSDYQKIGYKLDPSLTEHVRFRRSLKFFLFLNLITILMLISVVFDVWGKALKITQEFKSELIDELSQTSPSNLGMNMQKLTGSVLKKIESFFEALERRFNFTNLMKLIENLEVQSGIPKHLIFGLILYVTCFRYFSILRQMGRLSRGYLTEASSLKHFERLRLLNYQVIFYFFTQIFLLNNIQFLSN